MANRGKQFKALSPKKVSRRKRTPRCETCGKRDGEDVGGEGTGKVRLKLCARCRGVAYCGMECQKVGWKVHREVCVQYANAAELPPPSPLVNQKISGAGPRGRRKVIYGGAVGTVSATPRQRENAPTRHPFFGRQESAGEREPRVPVRKQKEQDLQQRTPRRRQQPQQQQQQPQPQQRHEQLANDDDGCPSPPVQMQRLSFPGGKSRTRQGSRPSSAGGDSSKRSPSSSKSPKPTQQHSRGSRESVAAAVKMAALRVRRSSHAAEHGTRSRERGSLSPPPPPPPSSNGGPVRRESAPLYPIALEKSKRRAASLAPSSAIHASRRGPPPPYASVAHRAESIKQAAPSTAVGTSVSGGDPSTEGGGGAAVGSATKAAEKMAAGVPARVPPSLPPSTAVNLGGTAAVSSSSPPPPRGSQSDEPPAGTATKSSQHSREKAEEKPAGGPAAARDDDADDAPEKSPLGTEALAGQTKPWIDGPQLFKPEEDGKELVGVRGEEDTDEPTPERRLEGAQSPGVFGAARGADAPSLAKDSTEDSAAGSTAGQAADTAAVPARPSLSEDSGDDSLPQDSAAASTTGQEPSRQPFLARDSSDSLSQDSAAASTMGQEPAQRPFLARDSASGFSHDSAAGSTAGQEDCAVPARPLLAKDSTGNLSQDSAAASTTGQEPAQPSLLAKDSDDSSSLDSAAASTAGMEDSTVPARPLLAKDSGDNLSLDSAAASTTGREEARRLPMEPPPPILPSSATSNISGLARASKEGVFDSCPPAAGASSKSGSHRSLSVGTSPRFHSMPLVLAAKGIATAAAAAWNADRKASTSPRPRPPVSPGPAALLDSFRHRKQSAAEPDDTAVGVAAFRREKAAAVASPPPSRTPSARSLSTGSRRASPRSGMGSPRSPPFVPAIELSPQQEKVQTSPRVPGPRPTDTAVFYRERLGTPPTAGAAMHSLPPPSRTYLGRPEGFSVHVLVASAPTRADLASKRAGLPVPVPVAGGGKDDSSPRLYYSFEDRGRVAAALQPGDVVLVTPGRYEARAWGLQRLIASVEIVGAGMAGECVIYNNSSPAAASFSHSGAAGEHYLLGVMGGALGGGGAGEGGASVPEVKGKDDVDDDSDSGFEDGAIGAAASSIGSFGGRVVRVRLANLTLEQGSGYRGAVYQLGRDSHLEMEGCTVVCSQGGVNIDQGTCAICDSTISGSEAFGVHVGGEGAVEHCLIRDCGRGGGGGGGSGSRSRGGKQGGAALPSNADGTGAAAAAEAEDDGTDVNRAEGMPAISFLQSSRVRVRFNVIRDNAGHSLQCRDAPLPGGDGKYAMLARRAEAEAEEKLKSWLGSAAVLLREHLQEQHREGSVVSEGNQCKLNGGCERAGCGAGAGAGRGQGGGAAVEGGTTTACLAAGEASEERGAAAAPAAPAPAAPTAGEEGPAVGGGHASEGPPPSRGDREPGNGARAGRACVPTAEEEGLPLPAAMTLRFLAAMDEGYVGSMREENARLRRRTRDERAG